MFYKISALHNHVQGVYILWTRWGTVGEDGQYQRTPYSTRDECVAEFLKVFKSKTSFPWAERASGVPKEGRYSVQPEGGKTLAELQCDRLKNVTPGMLPDSPTLPPKTQFLLRVLTDTHLLVANMVTNRSFQLPFGAAHQTAIKEAVAVLQTARDLLLRIGQLDQKLHQEESYDDDEAMVDEGARTAEMKDINKQREDILKSVKELSDQFYQLVPVQRDYSGVLRDVRAVDAALSELSILEQQNMAGKMIISAHAASNGHGIDPFDYILRACRTSITPLPRNDTAFETLLQYATPKRHNLEVVDIFEVSRNGEATRYMPFATKPNRMLLFHGTGACNALGVLADGLCCAPPAAAVHGHAYGKGIYFADAVDKSLQYATNINGNPNTKHHRIVFLAEVFLGRMDAEGAQFGAACSQTRDGYDSVVALNGPSTYRSLVIRNTGVRIPVGANDKSGHSFNEYVVFNPAQILLRYLVLLKDKNFTSLSDAKINALPMYHKQE